MEQRSTSRPPLAHASCSQPLPRPLTRTSHSTEAESFSRQETNVRSLADMGIIVCRSRAKADHFLS